MKKTVIAFIVLSLPTLSAQANEEYSGSRIGIGYNTTFIEKLGTHYFDYGDGIKLEYGYDINRIVGIKTSYEANQENGISLKGETVKIGADLGYAFDLNGWDIKPYGFLGVAHYSEERNNIAEERVSTSNSSAVVGMGVRANFDVGIYVDVNFDMLEMDSHFSGQSALTVGYKF